MRWGLRKLVRSFGALSTRRAALGRARTFLRDRNGSIIIPVALALPVLIGMLGLAVEVSYWDLHQRAMQNAADAAAIAAAMAGSANYDNEAKAVAAQYGFINGGSVTVSVNNPNTATNCTSDCYAVTISDTVPLYFSQVIGYQGNAKLNGNNAASLAASSVASSKPAYPYCILALGTSGQQGITSNGALNANLNSCDTMSDNTSTCNGHNLNAKHGDAAGTNNGCGNIQQSNAPKVSDPYASLASNIPTNTCKTYPQEPSGNKGSPLPSSNQWKGTYDLGGSSKVVCGDQQLTGTTTINNGVLVIENGVLDLNGYTLTGSGLTIVFTGSNSANYNHIVTDTSNTKAGVLDIAAPTSGPWSGIAVYQDPSLTKNVNISYAGNNPAWDITGIVYLPNSSVQMSGAINQSSQGLACFSIIVDNITINGTGSIFANDTQCQQAGANQPTGGQRGTLVF